MRRYRTVDVFTDRAFGGNPLAVVLDAEGLSTAQMQAVAREFDYAETTFVLPPGDPCHRARVRIFTPGSEIPFAGHPNIGTAFVLAHEDGDVCETLTFEEDAGLVSIRLLRDGGAFVGAELTAPQALQVFARVAASDAAACVGLTSGDVTTGPQQPCVASVGLPFLFVELTGLDALARARADVGAFERLLPCHGANAIYLHVRDPQERELRHARMFSPLDGIGEDPATGSAAAALVALLTCSERQAGIALDVAIRQGEAMGRPSLIRARAAKHGGIVDGIKVRGHCVPMFNGTFNLPGAA